MTPCAAQADMFTTPLMVAIANPDVFPPDFTAWLADNEHVWDAFVGHARDVLRSGYTHYSARTIIHVMRHHSAIRERGGSFKINNDHSPYLARLFDLIYPQHAGLWEYRETKKTDNL